MFNSQRLPVAQYRFALKSHRPTSSWLLHTLWWRCLECLYCESTKNGYASFRMYILLFKLERISSCVCHTLNSFKQTQKAWMKYCIPNWEWINCSGDLALNTEQFCACYSCYWTWEFFLVLVTLHHGIKLLTRCISFSLEMKGNTFQCISIQRRWWNKTTALVTHPWKTSLNGRGFNLSM